MGCQFQKSKKLCDIHADVFNMSIEDSSKNLNMKKEGHPIKVLKDENRALEDHMEKMLEIKKYEESEKKITLHY